MYATIQLITETIAAFGLFVTTILCSLLTWKFYETGLFTTEVSRSLELTGLPAFAKLSPLITLLLGYSLFKTTKVKTIGKFAFISLVTICTIVLATLLY